MGKCYKKRFSIIDATFACMKSIIVFYLLFCTTPSLFGQSIRLHNRREKLIVKDTSAQTRGYYDFHSPVPAEYYARTIPFFCRFELKMQRAGIPLSFRLGSMEQCNKLEQKPGYRMP
jgi:hypothetical protein